MSVYLAACLRSSSSLFYSKAIRGIQNVFPVWAGAGVSGTFIFSISGIISSVGWISSVTPLYNGNKPKTIVAFARVQAALYFTPLKASTHNFLSHCRWGSSRLVSLPNCLWNSSKVEVIVFQRVLMAEVRSIFCPYAWHFTFISVVWNDDKCWILRLCRLLYAFYKSTLKFFIESSITGFPDSSSKNASLVVLYRCSQSSYGTEDYIVSFISWTMQERHSPTKSRSNDAFMMRWKAMQFGD